MFKLRTLNWRSQMPNRNQRRRTHTKKKRTGMQTQREKVIKGVSLCSLRWTSVYRWRFIKSTIFPSSPPSSLSSLSSLYYLMVTFSRRIANLGIYPAMCSVCKPLHSELSYTQQSTSAHTSTHRHTHTRYTATTMAAANISNSIVCACLI